MDIKVSVIIPIYKVEKYLSRCIESVLDQTYQNLEIILVDDGSPDNCPSICDEYEKKDQRIKVIHKPNGGLSDARNAALKVFTGDYVYFLDSDDYVENNLIEIALKNMVAAAADLVIFNYYRVDEHDNLLSTSNFITGIYDIGCNKINYIVNILSKYSTGWEAWNRLYKADIIRNNNLFFWDNKLIFAEDFGFSLNYALHANKIICIPDVLHYYLIRRDSIMSQAAKEPRISAALALSKLLEDKIRSSLRDSEFYKNYPVLFYSIMYEQLRGLTFENYKKSLASIRDNEYFYAQIKRVFRNFGAIIKYHGILRGIVALLQCLFLLARWEKLNVHMLELYRTGWKVSEIVQNNNSKMSAKKRVFIVGSEDLNSVSNLFTAISMKEYLSDILPDYAMIEITLSEYISIRNALPFLIRKSDVICIPDGGDRVNAMLFMDTIRKDVVKKYKNNRIVIFAQALNYDSSEDGILQLKQNQSLISKCKDITLCVKDRYSYDLVKQYFDCTVVLIPDIVLYSNYSTSYPVERKGAMLLLQSDAKGIWSEDNRQLIEAIVQLNGRNIRYNDLQLILNISVFDRKDVLDAFLRKIEEVEIVITDRIYGMLFCAITKTPCIAILENNHIFESAYEGLTDFEYIIKINHLNELEETVQKLLSIDKAEYDRESIINKFDGLTKLLKNYVN
jgi:glycosyltransferase involved in cell wall biosynthesis/exopolysaccharide biosynthesis predicted pyruvyltransferase EpsI